MKHITIKEMSPRDGLQNEKKIISTQIKKQLIEKLIHAGLKHIEVTSFVNPQAVPQLADAQELCKALIFSKNVQFSALVPNQKGMERALETNLKEVAVFTATSETFVQKNIGCSIKDSLVRFKPVAEIAKQNKIKLRGYISTAFDCPYEGRKDPALTVSLAKELLKLGCYEVSIGDTIGKATPNRVETLFRKLLRTAPARKWAGHFHDTYHMAVANVKAAYDQGVQTFDASVGNLGGCPYATGASGNVATEDLVFLFNGLGVKTGVDYEQLLEIKNWIKPLLT